MFQNKIYFLIHTDRNPEFFEVSPSRKPSPLMIPKIPSIWFLPRTDLFLLRLKTLNFVKMQVSLGEVIFQANPHFQ